MAQSWYSVVDEEMASIDEMIRKGVRSSYPELNEMCENALNSRYHEVRPAISVLTYYVNGGKTASEAVANAICFEASFDGLHLHDRIDSNGKVLPGRKKKLFGKEPSTTKVIVAGDFMYVMGFRQAYSHSPKAVPYMMQASATISNAIFDLTDRMRDPEISEEDVWDLMKRKSAVEFQIIMESAANQAGAGEDALARMKECGMYIGSAVQIRSDMDDLFGIEGEKPLCHTLVTGYPTLALYHAMNDASIGQKVRDAYTNENLDPKQAKAVADLIKDSETISKCEQAIEVCKKNASDIIDGLPDSEYKAALKEFLQTI